MAKMIHSKYGYEPPEWVQADARLDKWYKNRKRRAKQHGAFNLEKNKEVQHEQIGNSSAKTQFNRQT
ncbi:hypothetical protein EFO81_06720 [Lactiplantibacillus plantarum]|uniref:hypothetical protein n=1 Tax=Lactiplantibacillus plantarum TaxID=1590 RepID=UPI000D2245CB|nr:hypothetical protein [Lactiplantibacillus plantarum]AVW06197.1 hypothetical protein DA078_11540 [Lactiplantibacillus plantarum]MCT3222383.1 hypothetical protein [Lactiplantibacillus plantarum]